MKTDRYADPDMADLISYLRGSFRLGRGELEDDDYDEVPEEVVFARADRSELS